MARGRSDVSISNVLRSSAGNRSRRYVWHVCQIVERPLGSARYPSMIVLARRSGSYWCARKQALWTLYWVLWVYPIYRGMRGLASSTRLQIPVNVAAGPR
jgi:hypothetical protein